MVPRVGSPGLGEKEGWFSLYLPQEHLLLSILPAYLAREMKAEIMARLQAGQGSRPESTNNFHSLYVKRHQGVR